MWITPTTGSATRLAAVVYALDKLGIDWNGSELAVILLQPEEESVVLPPGEWHLLDGTKVTGSHVFSRVDIGEGTVAFSAEWKPMTGSKAAGSS